MGFLNLLMDHLVFPLKFRHESHKPVAIPFFFLHISTTPATHSASGLPVGAQLSHAMRQWCKRAFSKNNYADNFSTILALLLSGFSERPEKRCTQHAHYGLIYQEPRTIKGMRLEPKAAGKRYLAREAFIGSQDANGPRYVTSGNGTDARC